MVPHGSGVVESQRLQRCRMGSDKQ